MKLHRASALAAGAILFAIFATCVRGQGSQSSRPPAAASAALQQDVQAPLPPGRVRVGGNVIAAQLLHMVQPVYPPIARTAGIQGTIVLHAVIAKDGTIKELQYISGPPLLMHSAMDAVRRWIYKPYLLNGEPVEVDTTIEVVFAIAGSPGPQVPAGEEQPRVSVVAVPRDTSQATGTPDGEEIELKNGSKLVGKVVSLSGDIFEIQLSGSKIQVARSEIASIKFPGNQSAPSSTTVPSPAAEVKQSLLGTTYTNLTGNFTLTIPDGWRTNDALAMKSPGTVGALSSVDGNSNILIQWVKQSSDPAQLAQLVDSMFKASFEGYQKLDQHPVTIDGRTGQVLTFRAVMAIGKVSEKAGTDSAADTTLKIPAKYMLNLIKADQGVMDIMCVSPETVFDKMQPLFQQISASFRMIPPRAADRGNPN